MLPRKSIANRVQQEADLHQFGPEGARCGAPALKDYIQGDPFLGRFFDVCLFEDLPASGRRADEIYLEEVDRCDIYLGVFANDYGYEDTEGVSPTEREFDRATVSAKERLVFITSEVKCLQFHGTTVAKPIPDCQIYKGTVFELVDQSVTFVMSKIAAAVGTRAESNRAPVTYELPRPAVAEAIVNAVAHRDYASNASVQVMLFADRLEIWNPGQLPLSLTPEALRAPHASIPHNPLIAEPLFLTRYVEKAGTGILDMISLCKAAELPPPQFRQEGGQFIQTLWRPTTAATAQVTAQVEQEPKLLPEKPLGAVADALGIPTAQVTAEVTAQVAAVLSAASSEAKSREDLQDAAGMKHREHFRKAYVDPLLTADWLRRTIPDKPTSRLQKYRVGNKGFAWLAKYRKHSADAADADKDCLETFS